MVIETETLWSELATIIMLQNFGVTSYMELVWYLFSLQESEEFIFLERIWDKVGGILLV